MFKRIHFVLILISIFCFLTNCTKQEPAYLDTTLPFEQRVDDLVGRMTLDEKISQMKYDAPAIKRLGIPKYNWWNECLHGVARAGVATVFPQAIGLAAMWDESFMFEVSTVISDEARAKHHEYVGRGLRNIYQGLTFWSPNINIFRDPRWGRGMETYGEDPYLTGRIGVAFVKGLQGNDPKYLKVVATAKHFAVHSGPEPARHTFDARVSERNLRETYLPAFEMLIKDAKAYSVMCAYNRYMGDPCCGSNILLEKILRGEWNFDGYVVSDCWAIKDFWANHQVVETPEQAVAMAVKAGTDLNCGDAYPNLRGAVDMGLIDPASIDTSVKRLFKARFKLGMFDPPDSVSYSQIPFDVNNSPEHDDLALQAARKSIVLLKNEKGILPLEKDLQSIAVIGPNADRVDILLGNYNGTPTNPVTPLQGIIDKMSGSRVYYAQGSELADGLRLVDAVPEQYFKTADQNQGIKVEYFNNTEFTGEPVYSGVDSKIDVYWGDGTPNDSLLEDDHFGVRWTGYLVPDESGAYELGANAFNGYRLFLDDELLVKGYNPHHPRMNTKSVFLQENKHYKITLKVWDTNGEARAHLVWAKPKTNLLGQAIDVARKSDAVILMLGLSPRLEGEEMKVEVEGFSGGDRISLDLPQVQIDLMKAIQQVGKPTILVLMNGSAVSVNWAAEHIPGIIEAWYPGQRGGTAIADVIFGDYNPAGRLPVTFYKSADQLPPFTDYSMTGKTYRYFKGDPLFPFGHGLSYTHFRYSDLQLDNTSINANENIKISVNVENMGERAGEEVVQLYVTDNEASVPVAIRSLKGFKRIRLNPGEKQSVTFTLKPRDLSLIDNQDRRLVERGTFRIAVGGKQPGFTGLANASTTQVLTTEFTVEGDVYIVNK